MRGLSGIPHGILSMGRPDRVQRRREMAEATWYAWTLKDLIRYFYLLGLLAAVRLVPLQMADSWIPYRGPPLLDPAVIGAFIVMFLVISLYLGVQGYIFFWRQDGVMDRLIARHEARETPAETGAKDDPR